VFVLPDELYTGDECIGDTSASLCAFTGDGADNGRIFHDNVPYVLQVLAQGHDPFDNDTSVLYIKDPLCDPYLCGTCRLAHFRNINGLRRCHLSSSALYRG
jgi:hypothetical protein